MANVHAISATKKRKEKLRRGSNITSKETLLSDREVLTLPNCKLTLLSA